MKSWSKIAIKSIVFLVLLFKSQITLSNELPIDPSIQKGTFENGLTYYIKENSKPENKAELRLVIKAGSMMEEDHQRGLAHLLEHVAFNGSKNFPKNSIDEYFNSIGLNLGSHFNAFTGFDTTSYEIEIPTDVDQALDQGLLFLSDIIKNLDLTDESFEKERKIVEEEILSDLTAGTKYSDLFLGELLQGSRYPQRLPRGDLEVIRNFKYQDVKDFYNLWYQPENIGLMIVGDFKKEEVFKIIEKYFSKIPNQKIKKQIDFTVPDYTEDKFLRYQDEKEDQIEFSIYKKNEFKKLDTKENYRFNILRGLTYDIFQKRLDEITYSNDPEFITGVIGNFGFSKNDEFEYFLIRLTEDNIGRGIKKLYTELKRVSKFGFNITELEEAKKRFLILSEDDLLESKSTTSLTYVNEFERNFTKDEMISGMEYELELDRELVPTITLDQINQYFLSIINEQSKFIEIKSPPNVENLPTLEEIKTIQSSVLDDEIEPYQSVKLQKLQINEDLKGSKIIKRSRIQNTGVQKFILENGVTVYLKPTDFEENVIYFKSRSDGGYSTADMNNFPTAKYTDEILSLADIGNLKKVDLRKQYPRKSLNVYPIITHLEEGIDGYSTNQFLEEMFMLIYQNFYNLKFDEKTVENFKLEKINEYINSSQDPQFEFNKNYYEEYYNKHPRTLYPDKEFLEKITHEKAVSFYKDRFEDAEDFVFVFVGDFEVNKIEPLIEKYIGSLKITNREESFIDHKIRFKENYKLFLYEEENPLNLNHIRFYNGYFKNTLKNRFKLYFIEDILDSMLMDQVREEKNLVYSISASSYDATKYPVETYSFIINYATSIKNEEKVNEEIKQVIKKFINNNYENGKFENVKKTLLSEHVVNLKDNIFWMDLISQYHSYGEPISRINYIDEIINSISRKELSKFAKKIFTEDYLKIVEKLKEK